jgi:glycosyltransferase involved in cell wall biosynthesis
MSVEILIPSCRPRQQIDGIVNKIHDTTNHIVITSCIDQSAAKNRNLCFNNSKADIVIYCDDDLAGFYKGWVEDLVEPLKDETIGIISARLLKMNGDKGIMQDYGISMSLNGGTIKRKLVPSACIAMRRVDLLKIIECKECSDNVPWDNNYQRASFEDSDLCEVYKRHLGKTICVNNLCKIKHKDEEKWRPNFDWTVNRDYYNKKWGYTP